MAADSLSHPLRQADDDIVGWVVNHNSNRQSTVMVTAVFENGATDITESGPIFVSNLAPHSASPFLLNPAANVAGKALNSLTVTGQVTGTKPTGGLHVEPCTFAGNVVHRLGHERRRRNGPQRRGLGNPRHRHRSQRRRRVRDHSDARRWCDQRLRDHLRGRQHRAPSMP